MKQIVPLLIVVSGVLAGQAAAPDPKRIVAVIEGTPFSADDLERMTAAIGPAVQMNLKASPKAFVEQLGLLFHLTKLAEQEKLDQQEPHKWRLQYNRALYLAQARMNAQNGRRAILPVEQQKYYEEHKEEFAKAKTRVIQVAVNGQRNEEAAEKLAADVVKQARAGADFPTLARTYSDDADSKAKGGEYPLIHPSDSALPAAVKTAVFQLKPGQVTDPIRQPAGYWIFKLEGFVIPPYEEVKDAVFTRIMDKDFQAWMEGVRKAVQVEIKDPAYFEPKAGQP